MRAAVYYNNNDVRLESVPLPRIGPGELLVKVVASGICGSDVMEWYRLKKAPLILGHEIAGEIVEVGKGVNGFKEGDRVFVSHHVPCNSCRFCNSGHHTVCSMLSNTNFDPGGFAEYIRIPAINVTNGTFLLPDELSFEEGTLIEPLACVVRGQTKIGLKPEQSVLVIGSGISGILHIQMARAGGAGRIFATDVSPYRLDAARRFGADAAFLAGEDIPQRVKDANDKCLADIVIVCAGSRQPMLQALNSVECGGTILFFAPLKPDETLPVPVLKLWREDITLTASYAAAPAEIAEAIGLIKSRRIRAREMITHRLGLGEAGLGFQLVAKGQDSLKVIIEPQR